MATKGTLAALPLLALVLTLAGCGDKAADKAKAEADLKAMCEKLLANTVIENYSISLS